MNIAAAVRPVTSLVASAVILIASSSLFAATRDVNDPAVVAKVKSLVQPYVDAEVIRSASIGLVSKGKTATLHFGKLTRDGVAPTDQSVYEIGSVSKVFTGILLADAVHRGTVKLDQPAEDLLPDGRTMPDYQGKKINLLDLSVHQSGLPRLPNNMQGIGSDNPYSKYTSDKALDFLQSYQLLRAPGAKIEYSNFAVSFLGHLLCRNAGKNYDDLLFASITGPLGMSSTTVVKNKQALSRLVPGLTIAFEPTSSWEFADMPGTGGIRSTVTDMNRFAAANLHPPTNDLGKALDLAWKKQRDARGDDFAMGLGWFIARDGQTRWHSGQTGGYHSMIFVNRQLDCAVVFLTNTATGKVDQLAESLIRYVAGAEVQPRVFEKSTEVSSKVMKQYEGRYQLAPGFIFTVKVVKDRLMVGLTGQPTFQVFPKSETKWFYQVAKAEITFKKNANGKVNELELFQNGVRHTAKRIE